MIKNNTVFWKWLSIAVFAMCFAILLIFLYWTIHPIKVVTHYTEVNGEYIEQTQEPVTFEVINSPVKKGETAQLRFIFEKHFSAPVDTVRELWCGDNLITLTPDISNTKPSGIRDITTTVTIPEKATTGQCQFKYTTNRQLNPIRNYEERLESNFFEIIE